MDYGERKCIVCGKIFTALKYYESTCSQECRLERIRAIHRVSDAKARQRRKEYLAKIIKERDDLLIENLALKQQLGIIGGNATAKEPASEPVDGEGTEISGGDENIPENHAAKDAPVSVVPSQVQGKGNPFVTKKEKACVICGRMFQPRGNRQNYCSKECLNKSHRKRG